MDLSPEKGTSLMMKSSLCLLSLVLCLGIALREPAHAQGAERHAVLIGGLGGTEEHTHRFRQYLFDARRALQDRFGFAPANIVVLAEAALEREDFVDAISSAEAIRSRFATLAGRVTAQDEVYVILFGHGSFDGQTAQLNIPRRDLTDADYAELLASLAAERVVFVNTASASAPFIQHVAAPGRIVITATRRGTERNETVFPRFFVEALADPASDLDRDGNVSILEIFRYASARTAQFFEDGGHLATERALLDDTGSGTGATEADLERVGQGALASVTLLNRRVPALASAGTESEFRERGAIERDIASLKARKPTLGEQAYYRDLEALLVRLARLNDRIESGESGLSGSGRR
jgi:hypothetical protein